MSRSKTSAPINRGGTDFRPHMRPPELGHHAD